MIHEQTDSHAKLYVHARTCFFFQNQVLQPYSKYVENSSLLWVSGHCFTYLSGLGWGFWGPCALHHLYLHDILQVFAHCGTPRAEPECVQSHGSGFL